MGIGILAGTALCGSAAQIIPQNYSSPLPESSSSSLDLFKYVDPRHSHIEPVHSQITPMPLIVSPKKLTAARI